MDAAGETGSTIATAQSLSAPSSDGGTRSQSTRHRRHDRWQARAAAGSGDTVAPVGSVGSAGVAPAGQTTPSATTARTTSLGRYTPKPGIRWQIQLTEDFDSSVDAELFDIDLFETSAETISALHAAGKRVICYFDTAYEPNRPDSAKLEPYRGNDIDGWPGQTWVDFRQQAVVEVMLSRLRQAFEKDCDGVDADDVDARDNDPGFPITASDQQNFIMTLANTAHALNLAYGLKNALDDVPALVDHVDFAVNEECFDYDECESLKPFIDADKPVLQIEYSKSNALQDRAPEICPEAKQQGLDTIIKTLDLTATRYSCR